MRSPPPRPHVLGIDDGPFEKYVPGAEAPLVGVMMEGPDRVEAVAATRFPVDGDGVTEFLAGWIASLRFRPAVQAVVFGGITLAGLAVLDPQALAQRIGLPVLVVNRRTPENGALCEALRAAGLEARVAQVQGAPPPFRAGDLYASVSGASREHAQRLLERTRGKSALPEPLRVAHLIARALATGESRGRA